MPKRVTGTTFDRATFVKRGAVRNPNNPSEAFGHLIWKADDAAYPEGASAHNPEGGSMTTEEYKAALAKAEKERDEARTKQQEAEAALARASKEKSDRDDDKDDDGERDSKGQFVKSELPEAARVAFEKQEREVAELRKAAEKAEEIAKAERDQRVTREFIQKAEDFRTLPVEPLTFGPVLKSACEKLTKDEFAEIERVLKAADEQVARGQLMSERGHSGPVPSRGSDGLAVAQKKAEELRKADPDLKPSEAFAKAMEDPTVAEAYAKEMAR